LILLKQPEVRTKCRRRIRRRFAVEPSETFVAGSTRQASRSRFRVDLALSRTHQFGFVNVEPIHYFMHARRLSFDPARHPPPHGRLHRLMGRMPTATYRQGIDGRAI
jgi:hypothetical protein